MKLNTLSTLHYLILISLVLLFTQAVGISAPKTSEPVNNNNVVSVKNMAKTSIEKGNSTEFLHGELLFR